MIFPWLKHQSWFSGLIGIELAKKVKLRLISKFWEPLWRKEITSSLDTVFEPFLPRSYMALLALAPIDPGLASLAGSQSSQNPLKVGALQHSNNSPEAPGRDPMCWTIGGPSFENMFWILYIYIIYILYIYILFTWYIYISIGIPHHTSTISID